MLLEKNYKRNKNGEIVKREIVEIKCDRCGREWESKYGCRKNKILDIDLCVNCRSKLSWSKTDNTKKNHSKKRLICDNCGKEYERIPSRIYQSIHNFCSHGCHFDFDKKKRYGEIENTFDQKLNEVAYLVGLILGDGHIKKRQKRTSNIILAFDYSEVWRPLIEMAKNVLSELKIIFSDNQIPINNCKIIDFNLPDHILEKCGILYSGDKFYANPFPKDEIIANINYAAGLLNSDGQFVSSKNEKWGSSYRFSNTVKSITCSLSKCLSYNDIEHTVSEYKGRFDKRTGKTNRKCYIVYVGVKGVKALKDKCSLKLKGDCNASQ